jgi:hypothetical protein
LAIVQSVAEIVPLFVLGFNRIVIQKNKQEAIKLKNMLSGSNSGSIPRPSPTLVLRKQRVYNGTYTVE